MALLGTLQVRMGLDTASFGEKFTGFTKEIEKRAKGLTKGLSGLTSIGSLIGGAGIGASLTQGINVAGQFESAVNQVAAASDLGASSIAGLQTAALDASKAFKVFDPVQTADAMLALAKAGISPAEQAAGTLAATMQLAATEGMDLGRAAEVMAEQMGAFGLKAKDGASIADALAGASVASTASVDGLAQGLSQVAAVASLSGLSLQDTAGTLALLAQNGVKGSDAGTSLKTMLLRLIPQTSAAAEEMAKFGISFENADGSIKSITEVADILKNKLGGLTDAQRTSTLQTIFGTDAYRAAAIMTKAGAAGLDTYIAATKDSQAAEKLSEARTRGYAGAITGLSGAIARAAIGITRGGFLQGLTDIANRGADLIDRLADLPQWAKNLGLGLAATAALLPPFAFALSSIVSAVPAILTGLGALTAFFAGPWGLAILAAAGVAVLFKDQIVTAWTGLQNWFHQWVADNQGTLALLKGAWDNFVAALGPLWEAIKKGFSDIAATVAAAFGTDTTQLLAAFQSKFGEGLTGAVQFVTVFLQRLTELVQWVTTNIPAMVVTFQTTFLGIKLAVQDAEARFQLFIAFMRALPQAVSDAISGLWEKIKATWDAIDWASLGRSVVDGITAGITSRAEAALTAARTLATGVEVAAKNALGIHSPSKVFQDIGENVGDGFVNGIIAKYGASTKAVQGLVTAGQGSGFTTSFMANLTKGISGPESQKAFADWTKSIKDGAIQAQSAWTASMSHIGSAIDEFVKTGKLDFSELVRSMIADLASSALKNAFNGILQGILGITSGGSGSSATGGGFLSGLGSIFGGLFGGLASFEGGGFTGSGARSGGLDGRGGRLAMLHPRETVVDHTRIKRSADRGGRGAVNLSVPITLMPGVSKEELSQILPLLKRDIIETIPRLIARGGRYAGAYGQ